MPPPPPTVGAAVSRVVASLRLYQTTAAAAAAALSSARASTADAEAPFGAARSLVDVAEEAWRALAEARTLLAGDGCGEALHLLILLVSFFVLFYSRFCIYLVSVRFDVWRQWSAAAQQTSLP
jgi:hypothetical protein